MAPQQESNKDGAAAITPTMEEEEEEEEEDEEEEHHRHGERPLLLSACEQEQDAGKPLPLPAKRRRSSSSLSRSSRSGEQGQEEAAGPGGGARSLSFSRLFSSFRMMATSTSSTTTLDIDELAAAEDGRAALNPQQQQQWKKPVCRTQSMPMTSISRRLPAHGGRKRVADSSSLRRLRVSSLSFAPLPELAPPPSSPSPSEGGEEEEEEVGEEEAVCRICMVALLEEEEEEEGGAAAGAGDGVLKLECRCKGELALAHRRCALKWFGIKGNPNCDVCGHDVLNLPVTLRRLPPPPPPPPLAAGDNGTGSQEEEGGTARRGFNRGVWRHGTVILVTVSMLAYFCFLEQLLVGDHGNAAAALAVSAPFAVVLGTFSALTTAGMASSRRYVWAYSALQFLLVVLFTHLFYRYVRLQPVIAIILSAFAGFGVAICANALLLQAARWRAATARRPPPPPSDLDIPQP